MHTAITRSSPASPSRPSSPAVAHRPPTPSPASPSTAATAPSSSATPSPSPPPSTPPEAPAPPSPGAVASKPSPPSTPPASSTASPIGTTDLTATSTADPTKADTITLTITPQGALRWTRQFGTSSLDSANGIATDANGNVYTTGYTHGALEGSNAGGADAFIRAYDPDGSLRWTRQFGTSSNDYANGIATDANGSVYTTGFTQGALEGTNAGSSDAFIRAYDTDGNLRWTRQFGTSSFDAANGIATDANGNLYTTGTTDGALEGPNAGRFDAFIRAYDTDGNLRWTRQFGTSSDDYANGIATDANGNVYTSGYTQGALEGSNAGSADAFIRAYDTDGNLRWTRQFGTAGLDSANGITTDADGNVYTTGDTSGALEGPNAGQFDAFIRAYDNDGTLRWTRQFGTSSGDARERDRHRRQWQRLHHGPDWGRPRRHQRRRRRRLHPRLPSATATSAGPANSAPAATISRHGIAADANGDAYVAGITSGALVGTNAGSADAFVRSYGR